MKIDLADEDGNILTLSSDSDAMISLTVNEDGTVDLTQSKFKVKSISV